MNPSVRPSAVSGDIDPVVVELMEDLANRAQAGERIDGEAIIAAHPEHAEELRRLLPAVEVLADLGRSASAGGASPPSGETDAEPVSGVLGDFRIIREVGRGGMGLVYEAEQISLGRRVALKVLPFAATMDPRHLQRFHNEARAAAGLHHGNIVPVYAVGCERAVHFYAMQFIEGQTLAAMVADLRQRGGRAPVPEAQPTTPHVPGAPAPDTGARAAVSTERAPLDRAYFRRVSELGIQAAEALDHAHQMGIVHRDVKPANLMVDGRSHLWVTDFGLAQVQSDVRLTQTGDLLGTLRYMSPEQALAQRVVVDHRTDVYSLGVTLYELLTLEPAFRGNDRQELLRQVAFEEPKSPRQITRAVPAELETIVLKAMEKNPADRYGTAQELAADLRRWMGDEPIRARRPGVIRRLEKWGRRHRAAVTGGFVLVLLAAVVFGASTAVVGYSLGEKTEALRLANLRQQELAQSVANAKADRQRADEVYLGAVKAMNDTVSRAEELADSTSPTSAGVRDAVRQEAVAFYRDYLRKSCSDGGPIDNETGWAYLRLGNFSAVAGRFADARDAYEKARTFFASAWMREGTDDQFPDERPAVEKMYREALKHCRETEPSALADVPDIRVTRFDSYYRRRNVQYTDDLTGKMMLRAEYCRQAGGPEESLRAWRQEMALAEALAADHPQKNYAQRILGESFQRRTKELMDAGRHPEARDVCLGTVVVYERLATFPIWGLATSSLYARYLHPDLQTIGFSLAECLQEQGRPTDAVRVGCLAAARLERVIAASAEPKTYRLELADRYGWLADVLWEAGRLDEAEAHYRKAISEQQVIWENDFSYGYLLASRHNRLGLFLLGTGRFDDAEKAFHEALAVMDAVPERLRDNLAGGGAHYPDGARAQRKELLTAFNNNLDTVVRVRRLDANIPAILSGKEQPATVEERAEYAYLCQLKRLYVSAVRLYQEAITAKPELGASPTNGVRYNAACAAARAGCGAGLDTAKLTEPERTGLRKQAAARQRIVELFPTAHSRAFGSPT